ncbi:MAG TPA: prolyl oligopeptidase family serine peptidase [Rugosimonospora sp.]|nr:prolyl oligopeptidase family serine peptidase [Rugosimonospora sp.]
MGDSAEMWSGYARAVPWNVRVEDASRDRVLASATVLRGGEPVRAHLVYENHGGYGLVSSWTGSTFARWTRDGGIVEMGAAGTGRQQVRCRATGNTTSVIAEVEAGGYHAYAAASGWLAWLVPRREGGYGCVARGQQRLADLRRGITGWRGHALNVHNGHRLVIAPQTAGAQLVPEPPSIAAGRAAFTISRPDGHARHHSGLLLVDLATGWRREVWSEAHDLHGPVLHPDRPAGACVASTRLHDADTPLTHLVQTWTMDGAQPRESVHDGRDAWATPLAWVGDALYGLEIRYGVQRLVALHAGRPGAGGTGDDSVSSAVVAGSTAVTVVSSPVRPQRLQVYELGNGSAPQVVDEVPRPDLAYRGSRRVFSVPGRRSVHPVATRTVRPEGTEAGGVVVLLHGGPTMSWSDWSWRWNPLPFVARGYATVLVDPAGSAGFGTASLRQAWRSWRHGIVDSALAALRETLRRERLEGLPLALMGGSFGGYLAVALASCLPVDVVVGHAVPFRPSSVSLTSDAYWSWVREWVDGGADGVPRPDEDDIDLTALPLGTRYLFSHGMMDDLVPHHETVRATRLLRSYGAECDMALLPSSGHALTAVAEIEPWLDWALTRTEEGFRR